MIYGLKRYAVLMSALVRSLEKQVCGEVSSESTSRISSELLLFCLWLVSRHVFRVHPFQGPFSLLLGRYLCPRDSTDSIFDRGNGETHPELLC